jgi:C4-type Zn-finger protein
MGEGERERERERERETGRERREREKEKRVEKWIRRNKDITRGSERDFTAVLFDDSDSAFFFPRTFKYFLYRLSSRGIFFFNI